MRRLPCRDFKSESKSKSESKFEIGFTLYVSVSLLVKR